MKNRAPTTILASSSSTPRQGRRRLGRPALVLILIACFLAVGEMIAGAALAGIEKPSSYLDPRNPHFIRDWVAFTAPPPGPKTGFRVIVISNSQGFIRERAEGEWSYSARLEEYLRDAGYGADAEVLNWSLPGGSGREMIVLAARAVEHQPDAVILVSYNNDFHPILVKKRLGSIRSDVVHLAYLSDVRKYLPSRFLRQSRAHGILDWLGAHSKMIAWRNRHVDQQEYWSFVSAEPGPLTKLKVFNLLKDVSAELLEDFLSAVMSGESKPAVLIVSMPLNEEQFENFQYVGNFADVAGEVAKSWPGTQALDASELYAPELFYGGRHMRPEAHTSFAEYLLQHLPSAPRD